MILTCPLDQMVLDLGEWDQLSINLKTGDAVYVWPRCASNGRSPHWVRVTWRGKTPTVDTGPIVAVTPAISRVPDRGMAPAPPQPRLVVKYSVGPMVIRKRGIS